MIKIHSGPRLYRTNCGSVIRFDNFARNRRGVVVSVPSCRSSDERCKIGLDWAYFTEGYWMGAEGDGGFHLHLKEEILP